MKIFTINPHFDEVNEKIDIINSLKLVEFTINDRKSKGIDLGFFQKDLDPEHPVKKFFKVFVTDENTDQITDVRPFYKDGNFKSLTVINESEDLDKACIFLNCNKPYGRARFTNELDLIRKKILVSGKIVGDKVITNKNGQKFRDECHPSILIISKDETYTISFFNTLKKYKQLAYITYDGENVNVTIETVPSISKKPSKLSPFAEELINCIREADKIDVNDHHERKKKNKKWEKNRKEDKWN